MPLSCLEATEVDVTVTTDLRCSTEEPGMYQLDRTDVQVLVDGETRQIGTKAGCVKNRVGNIVFVPGGSGEVRLHVVGAVGGEPDPITADRILRFLPHQSLRLDVELSSACVRVKCGPGYTCIKGSCAEIPRVGSDDAGISFDADPTVDANKPLDGGSDDAKPLDGASDVLTIGDGNAGTDGGDGGKLCAPSPFLTTDVHWGFNEGVNATTIRDDSMAYMATLIANVSLATNPPCKTGLSFNGATAQNLSTTNWGPSPTLGIAFDFQFTSGSGTIIERNPGKAGGWRFSVNGSGKLVFDLWNNNNISVPLSVNQLVGPTTVVGTFAQGTEKLVAYGANATNQNVVLNLQGYNSDINVGSPNFTFRLDELWLGR